MENRPYGKTALAILKSVKENKRIFVYSDKEAKRIKFIAKKLKLKIPEPIIGEQVSSMTSGSIVPEIDSDPYKFLSSMEIKIDNKFIFDHSSQSWIKTPVCNHENDFFNFFYASPWDEKKREDLMEKRKREIKLDRNHPKIIKLESMIGENASFCLEDLFLFALNKFPDGVFHTKNQDEIESAAGWSGGKGVFVKSLLELGILDSNAEGFFLIPWIKKPLSPWTSD